MPYQTQCTWPQNLLSSEPTHGRGLILRQEQHTPFRPSALRRRHTVHTTADKPGAAVDRQAHDAAPGADPPLYPRTRIPPHQRCDKRTAAPTPYLTLSFDPPNPGIAGNAPAGTVVATIAATWSDGTPFIGTLSFGPPYFNDNATFAISGNQLIVNSAGPGVSADGGTPQNVTVTATQ